MNIGCNKNAEWYQNSFELFNDQPKSRLVLALISMELFEFGGLEKRSGNWLGRNEIFWFEDQKNCNNCY